MSLKKFVDAHPLAVIVGMTIATVSATTGVVKYVSHPALKPRTNPRLQL